MQLFLSFTCMWACLCTCIDGIDLFLSFTCTCSGAAAVLAHFHMYVHALRYLGPFCLVCIIYISHFLCLLFDEIHLYILRKGKIAKFLQYCRYYPNVVLLCSIVFCQIWKCNVGFIIENGNVFCRKLSQKNILHLFHNLLVILCAFSHSKYLSWSCRNFPRYALTYVQGKTSTFRYTNFAESH